jgi:YD repeat-containing protein
MQLVRYRRWNWEFDYGEVEISTADPAPADYTDAQFDPWGRLVRAVCHDSGDHWSYEYFCDEAGRVLEKRSYDEKGQLTVLVRIQYDLDAGLAIETAWGPDQPGLATAHIPLAKYPDPGSVGRRRGG